MDLGSGIRKKPFPDPGVKKHRIPHPDPQHWIKQVIPEPTTNFAQCWPF
jgi:hypothetical protein